MATLRGSGNLYNVGSPPPRVIWTMVRGDTASFKVYATDDNRQPLNIPDWTIKMKIKRPNNEESFGKITDDAILIHDVYPEADSDDKPGEFTVFLTSAQTNVLQTGDIFDIEISTEQDQIVWTVCQGSTIILEDVTD
jgi:hypothetical protein